MNNSAQATFAELKDVVAEEMARLQVPGVALGVWTGGQTYTAGFGVTNVNHSLPVDADTLFQIGSITKTVTGTAAMRLVEQGRLDLHAPLRAYLPDLILSDPEVAAKVTLWHLFTHTGGWAGDYFSETGRGAEALPRYVAEMAELEQLTPPGTIWAYNNAGFSLAGLVIEAVTGQRYEDVVQEQVFAPLGMDHSYFFPEEVMVHRFAVGHHVDYDDGDPEVAVPWALACSAHAAGGVTSSVNDQLRYARFHLGDGTAADGTRLLSKESMVLMQTPQVEANLGNQFGITWFLRDIDGARTVRHGGATKGQNAVLWLVPERDFALSVLTNGNRGSELHEAVSEWALAHYLGLKPAQPEPLALPESALLRVCGTYEAQLAAMELYVEDGQLMMQVIPRGGFPDKDSPPSPAAPPVRAACTGEDQLIALDPPFKGMRADIIRDEAGQIRWLRTSRLHRRRED